MTATDSWLWRFGVAAVTLAPMCGCDRPDRPEGAAVSSAAPADSLALVAQDGIEIWYSVARPATGAGGSKCIERGLEIRRDGKSIQVPLLYTGEPPTLLNDSAMRATLWTDCRPVAAYLVNLRTGRPVRESGRK